MGECSSGFIMELTLEGEGRAVRRPCVVIQARVMEAGKNLWAEQVKS